MSTEDNTAYPFSKLFIITLKLNHSNVLLIKSLISCPNLRVYCHEINTIRGTMLCFKDQRRDIDKFVFSWIEKIENTNSDEESNKLLEEANSSIFNFQFLPEEKDLISNNQILECIDIFLREGVPLSLISIDDVLLIGELHPTYETKNSYTIINRGK